MSTYNLNFEQLKQKILPYFIEIYGEEYTDLIVSRMNAIEPIFYSTIDGQRNKMYSMQTAKRIELTFKFLEANGIVIPENVKDEIIRDNSSYGFSNIPEANDLLTACFDSYEYREVTFDGIRNITNQPIDNDTLKSKNIEIFKKLGVLINAQDYNNWLSTDEAKQAFDRIEKLKDEMTQLDIEFSEFNRQFDDLKLLIAKKEKIERTIKEDYIIEFLKSIEQYMSEDDKKKLKEFIASNIKDWLYLKKNISIMSITGDPFFDDGLLFAFSSKGDEILSDPQMSNFTKKILIDDRIKYYKIIGLYQEQMTPEEFVFSPEAIANIPNRQFIDDAILKKEHFKTLGADKIASVTSSYNENLNQINSLNLATKLDLTIDHITKNKICVMTGTKIIDSHPKPTAILFFSPESCLPSYIDVTFIHEINHAVELSLLNHENGKSSYKSGFEFLTDEEDEERYYEGFSEVINQIISMEITEAMHRDNIYLFDNPITSKIVGGTSYEQQRNFVELFWQKFKKEIMASRVDNNLNLLLNVIGENNYNDLNNIINEYRKLPYYCMMSDVMNGRTTELTQKRTELFNSAMKTCNLMMEKAKGLTEFEELDNPTIS